MAPAEKRAAARAALDNLSQIGFLTGDDHAEEDSLDIDKVFSKPFERVAAEAVCDQADALQPTEGGAVTPSLRCSGYTFVPVEAGLALFAPDGQCVGGYIWTDLSIQEAHKNKGLGAELVLEYYLRNGEIPTWHLDTPAYSPAGLGAHRAAWSMATRDPDLVLAKVDALAEAEKALQEQHHDEPAPR